MIRDSLAFAASMLLVSACSYPDYGFEAKDAGPGGAGGSAGSAGASGGAGNGGQSGSGGSAGTSGTGASGGTGGIAPTSCNPSQVLSVGAAVPGSTASGQGNVTDNIDSYSCSTQDNTGNEAAWTFTPSASGNYRFDLTGLDADCDLFVLSAAGCTSTCLTSSAKSENVQLKDESVIVTLTAGTSYFVSVDSDSSAQCTFQLQATQL